MGLLGDTATKFNNYMNTVTPAGNMGLLTGGLSLLGGGSLPQALQTGVGMTNNMRGFGDDAKKRKALEVLRVQFKDDPVKLRALNADPEGFLAVYQRSLFATPAGDTNINVNTGPDLEALAKAMGKDQGQSIVENASNASQQLRNLGELRFSISAMEEAIAEGKAITGPFSGTVSKIFGPVGEFLSGNSGLTAVRESVAGVVQQNLKEVLGGQFSQLEGENLIARAFNPQASPKENLRRLKSLEAQMTLALKQKQDLEAWGKSTDPNRGPAPLAPTMADYYNALEIETDGQGNPVVTSISSVPQSFITATEGFAKPPTQQEIIDLWESLDQETKNTYR